MIKPIEKQSVHRITSGQVLVDLQTAVKELVENSLDAGATNLEVKFKDSGLRSFEVVDNGSGIAAEDYDHVALKHYTSKLSTFEDIASVQTFGFRGEALSSLCALTERVTITTATSKEAPMGTILELDKVGNVLSRSGKVARQRGTTVFVEGLFTTVPVRRKEFQRNSKREFNKALTLLTAYALVPCSKENKGVRLSVVNIQDGGRKSSLLRTDGQPSLKASISSLWGPKQLESLTELSLDLEVVPEKSVLRRQGLTNEDSLTTKIQVRGIISKFSPGNGRTGSDRQFFFINGRPCSPSKIQKAFNEVYRTFNANQSPFIVADFALPRGACDINVSPDKRTILLHSENALVAALKEGLEETFASSRSTFDVQTTQAQKKASQFPSRTQSKSLEARTPKSQESSHKSQETLESNASGEPASPPDVNTGNIDTESLPPNADLHTPSRHPDIEVGDDELKASIANSHTPSGHPDNEVGDDELKSSIDDEPPSRPLITTDSPRPTSSTGFSPHPSSSQSTVPVKPAVQPVQMVLSTANASWSMRTAGSEQPPRKKAKLGGVIATPGPGSAVKKSASARSTLRSRLIAFYAVPGSTQSEAQDVEEEERDEKDDSEDDAEEDELDAEELVEMQMDPDADLTKDNKHLLDTTSDPSGVRLTGMVDGHGSGNDQFERDPPLFLPDPDVIDQTPVASNSSALDPQSAADDRRDVTMAVENDTDIDAGLSTEREENLQALERRFNLESDGIELLTSVSASTDDLRGGANVEAVRAAGRDSDVCIRFDLVRVAASWKSLRDLALSNSSSPSSSKSAEVVTVNSSAGISNTSDEESAERELSRVISKDDFASMEILGQFNLGFIIARRQLHRDTDFAPHKLCDGLEESDESTPEHRQLLELDDLFIIDQHAADEKYNFETLQQTTKIECQKLFRPRPLELTAADELVALENIDVLRHNGFEISVDEDAEPSQGRIKLVAQPVSGSTSFEVKDLEELIHLMHDRPPGKMVRCSKARAMFAMRACRKSVMIGMALNKAQMTSVIRHMGTMDQPWNCPHGRPTMRHLVNLSDLGTSSGEAQGAVDRRINWNNL